MKNATQNLPICNLPMNCDDRFYADRCSLVTNEATGIDGRTAPRMPAGTPALSAAGNESYSWWSRSYNQGLPAVGGRYQFLRGAWIPAGPCADWNASASWGSCEPSTGEAC